MDNVAFSKTVLCITITWVGKTTFLEKSNHFSRLFLPFSTHELIFKGTIYYPFFKVSEWFEPHSEGAIKFYWATSNRTIQLNQPLAPYFSLYPLFTSPLYFVYENYGNKIIVGIPLFSKAVILGTQIILEVLFEDIGIHKRKSIVIHNNIIVSYFLLYVVTHYHVVHSIRLDDCFSIFMSSSCTAYYNILLNRWY